MATDDWTGTETDGPVSFVDRALYALFSRRADSTKHERDRHRYRAANLGTSFDTYIARVYGLSWLSSVLTFVVVATVVLALPAVTRDAVAGFVHGAVPVFDRVALPNVPPAVVAVGAGAVTASVIRWAVVRAGGVYLRWQADARQADIETTLPGAVRYLRVLASGSSDQRAMLRRVADQDAYGETATSFRRALNEAALTGSLDAGLELVARDTPSRNLLAPFLLKYREHADQGSDALAEYLRMESRLLSHQQSRTEDRVAGYLELLAELFVVLLVFPALTVLIVTVMSVLAPGLSREVATPLGVVTTREVIVYSAIAFVLCVGAATAAIVASLRPDQHATPVYDRPTRLTRLIRTASVNPASAAIVCAPLAVGLGIALWTLDYALANVALLGYVGFGVPVGVVSVRRARLDDAKDREIRDFVHAIAGHVALGRPFSKAVGDVAGEVDHGALQPDIESLAFSLSLTTGADSEDDDVRAAALDKFVDDVGTPMAEQTMGLVVGALESGSDTEQVFEALQTEIGALYHRKKQLRSTLLVYVAVGWTTGLLVLGIVVAVNATVLDGFAQLATISNVEGAANGFALDPDAVVPARERWRFYLVTQATMLSCGWFAGMASRGRYEALLHSGVLVGLAYAVFAGAGML
jgi:archaellum biogenesis protein FlaJ (TadC family)